MCLYIALDETKFPLQKQSSFRSLRLLSVEGHQPIQHHEVQPLLCYLIKCCNIYILHLLQIFWIRTFIIHIFKFDSWWLSGKPDKYFSEPGINFDHKSHETKHQH